MKDVVRRLPIWLAGLTVAAAGVLVAAPPASALGCGEQAVAGFSGGTAEAVRGGTAEVTSGVAAWSSPVQVTGPGSLAFPAGGATPFSVTVTNAGPGFTGRIQLQVTAKDPLSLPVTTMERSISSETVKTWKTLPADVAPGMRSFTADGLSFHTGEASTEFRVHVPLDALGRQLHVSARIQDAAGRLAGSTDIDATVTDAALRVHTTFPTQLRRGGTYREFDVDVGNPSTITYHNVRALLSMTGLTGVPTSREAGYLTFTDIQLENRSDGTWKRLTITVGCDPVSTAALGGPFDLRAGASRTLHLRIRLADSPATKPLAADYYLDATPAGHIDAQGSHSGRFLIQPRQTSTAGQGGMKPTTTAKPATAGGPTASPTTPTGRPEASTGLPVDAASRLPDTGRPIWPLAGGAALLLGGVAALLYTRRRRHTAGD